MNKIYNIIKLIRVKHWLKNFLIFIPALFSGTILKKDILINSFIGFLIFSLTASLVYIINDISDIEKDKLHKTKKERPLACGKINLKEAYMIFTVILLITLLFLLFSFIMLHNYYIIIIPVIYLILNILYSKKLKDYPIIDVIVLSFDYILRIIYGAVLTNVTISNWLYLVVMFASLFMGFGKRKKELESEGNTRKVLAKYNIEFLSKNMYVCMACSIIFYSLWSIDAVNNMGKGYDMIKFSIPLVIIILFIYSYLIESHDKYSDGDPIEIFFSNKWLIILSALYCILLFMVFYGV